MKYLLILLTFLSLNVNAQLNGLHPCKNSGNKILESEAQAWVDQSQSNFQVCSSGNCLCIEGVDPLKHDLVDQMILDFANGSEEIEEEEACTLGSDCDTKVAAKVCSDNEKSARIEDLDGTNGEVECYKTIYPLIASGRKIFELNETKAASVDLERSQEATKRTVKTQIRKYKVCGENVIDEIIYRNSAAIKNLSNGQKKQMMKDYEDIMQLLRVGNLPQAKLDIQSATADGTIVTEDDKTTLVNMIDACL